MMSQVEIFEMKNYCESRNRARKGCRTFNIWNLMFLLAGIIMITLSACLLTYVSIVGMEFTGMIYVVFGVMGIATGLSLIRIASWKL